MQTWLDIKEMRRGLMLMRQGNQFFAWQNDSGKYRTCYDINQLELFEGDIYDGAKTVGFYSIRPDNLTRWGAIDFDDHGTVEVDEWRNIARRAFEKLAPKFPEAWLEESSPNRFHVIVFEAHLTAAQDIRETLREYAPKGVEVFPSQNEHKDGSKRMGNLLRFPGRHQLKGTQAVFIDRHGRIEEPELGIPEAKPKCGQWIKQSEAGRLASLYAVVTRGITISGPGQRFNAMQRIVGRLKGRAKLEVDALWVHETFFNRYRTHIRTPFDESRVEFLTWYRKAAPCNVEIPEYPLTANEATAIAGLPKMPNVPAVNLAATVRLILYVNHHAASKGQDIFFLSIPSIGRRLKVSVGSAYKYMDACRKLGIVELLERGHTGWASTYRLIPVGEWDLKPFRPPVQNGFKSGAQRGHYRVVSSASARSTTRRQCRTLRRLSRGRQNDNLGAKMGLP